MAAAPTFSGFSVLPVLFQRNAKTVTRATIIAESSVYGKKKSEVRSLKPEVAALLAALAAGGVTIAADGERLTVTPASRLTDPQRDLIRENKLAIMALLAANDPAPALRYATEAQLADDRRTCRTCRELAYNGKCQCAERGELPMAAPWYEPIQDSLARCIGYRPGADDVDQRTGRERWPGLARRLDAGLTMPVRSKLGKRSESL